MDQTISRLHGVYAVWATLSSYARKPLLPPKTLLFLYGADHLNPRDWRIVVMAVLILAEYELGIFPKEGIACTRRNTLRTNH